jgi:hypothetical protein
VGEWFTHLPLCGVVEPGDVPSFRVGGDGRRVSASNTGLGNLVVVAASGVGMDYCPGSHVTLAAEVAISPKRGRYMAFMAPEPGRAPVAVFAFDPFTGSTDRRILPYWAAKDRARAQPVCVSDEPYFRALAASTCKPVEDCIRLAARACARFGVSDTTVNVNAIQAFNACVSEALAVCRPEDPSSFGPGIVIAFSSFTAFHSGTDSSCTFNGRVAPPGAAVTAPFILRADDAGEATVTLGGQTAGCLGQQDVTRAVECLVRFGAVVIPIASIPGWPDPMRVIGTAPHPRCGANGVVCTDDAACVGAVLGEMAGVTAAIVAAVVSQVHSALGLAVASVVATPGFPPLPKLVASMSPFGAYVRPLLGRFRCVLEPTRAIVSAIGAPLSLLGVEDGVVHAGHTSAKRARVDAGPDPESESGPRREGTLVDVEEIVARWQPAPVSSSVIPVDTPLKVASYWRPAVEGFVAHVDGEERATRRAAAMQRLRGLLGIVSGTGRGVVTRPSLTTPKPGAAVPRLGFTPKFVPPYLLKWKKCM